MSVKFKNSILNSDPELKKRWHENESRRNLSQALVLLRKHEQLTQDQLAKKLGWKQSMISRLESVTGPMPDTLTIQKYVSGCNARLRLVIESTAVSPKGVAQTKKQAQGVQVNCELI